MSACFKFYLCNIQKEFLTPSTRIIMLPISKFNPLLLITASVISLATITSPLTSIFGKKYLPEKDYSCCKQNHLVFYHFYEVNVFWIDIYEGFTMEATNKSSQNGCNILCDDKQ